MNRIRSVIRARRPRHTRRTAKAVLRVCASLCLVFHIVYTPIHLCLEPHSDDTDIRASAAPARATVAAEDEDHAGGGHHGRHPALEHKFKVLKPERVGQAEMSLASGPVPACTCEDCPPRKGLDSSGLSPPELPRSWQFILRAALPVRAPSFLS
jgi:hypothetical protein